MSLNIPNAQEAKKAAEEGQALMSGLKHEDDNILAAVLLFVVDELSHRWEIPKTKIIQGLLMSEQMWEAMEGMEDGNATES
jgi:hypothetical protein